jgi:hypothetical protein
MSISESRILELALARLEDKRRAIDIQIAEIKAHHRNGEAPASSSSRQSSPESVIEAAQALVGVKPRRRMSVDQRMAISEKLRERWAQRKQQASKVDKSSAEYADKMKPRLIKASQQPVTG